MPEVVTNRTKAGREVPTGFCVTYKVETEILDCTKCWTTKKQHINEASA